MKLLITGGAGFIGSNFVRYWREHYPKDKITVLDKMTYAGNKKNLEGIKSVNFVIGDICNHTLVEKLMLDIDVVVHFAAESHVDRSIMKPYEFVKTNVLGTQVLLHESLTAKVKLFHHVSTDEVFGSLKLNSTEKFNEKTSYNPQSPYSASKASSDHLVRAYHQTYGLPVTISNTSNNYGPRQDPEKLIPRFITNLILDKRVPLMGKGENVRDWIHVSDHISGIELIINNALKNTNIIGQTFCIGANEEKTNFEITQIILKYFKKDDSWINYIPHRLGHDARYAIDSSKIRKMLGWKPLYRFEDQLLKTIEWYTNNRDWWEPLVKNKLKVDPNNQKKYGQK